MIATALLYLFNLLLILLASVYLMRSRNKEHFFAARAVPYNQSSAAVSMNDLPFITQNEFLVWKNSLVFRNDINVSKNTYEPKYLENLLKPFANNNQLTAADYSELTANVKISLLEFQKITDMVMNIIVNAINYDLFRNPNRPLEIICPNLNSCSINLIQKKIISIQQNKKNGKLKWFILLEVILSKKGYSYGITCVVEDNQLVNISVIGIRSEDDLKLLSSRANQQSFWGQNTDKPDSIILPRNKTNSMVNKYLNRQLMQSEVNLNRIQELPNEYRCYGSYGSNQLICENSYDSYYNKKKRGVWDKICTTDSECPFYKANKNYTNKFGGCVDGFCEMPLGIKSVSPFFYDIHSTPLCYNCPNKSLNCCKDQKNPDYIFNGDIIVRKAYENDLIQRGLNIT